MKTVKCDACAGTGKYYGEAACVRCSGKGLMDKHRLTQLRTRYFPRRLTLGIITPQVFEHEVAIIDGLLTQLDAAPVVPLTDDPIILSPELCDKHGITHDTPLRVLKQKFPLIFVKEF